jgi:hypothetical protein
MNLFLTVLVAGMAVAYVNELIGRLLEFFIDTRLVKQLLSAPLSYGAVWILGISGLKLAVAIPASGFVALGIMMLLNRPLNIQQVVQRKLP